MRYLICLFGIVCCLACHDGKFQVLDDGIIVQLDPESANDVHQIKLQVISDKIIHVLANASDSFSSAKSLIAVDKKTNPVNSWKVTVTKRSYYSVYIMH